MIFQTCPANDRTKTMTWAMIFQTCPQKTAGLDCMTTSLIYKISPRQNRLKSVPKRFIKSQLGAVEYHVSRIINAEIKDKRRPEFRRHLDLINKDHERAEKELKGYGYGLLTDEGHAYLYSVMKSYVSPTFADKSKPYSTRYMTLRQHHSKMLNSVFKEGKTSAVTYVNDVLLKEAICLLVSTYRNITYNEADILGRRTEAKKLKDVQRLMSKYFLPDY
ncbi:uncharacterized protein LOC141915504 [Tubulanus polymorphus]|uniref:uncharacterized protein LOC141915504 n=1 Tax=Tubulanus polymorphus TaxID=672921 RepID=UPI003DA5CE8D